MSSNKFTYPFRYVPAPEISEAARRLIGRIQDDHHLASLFEEGKMMGVLRVAYPDGHIGFLYGFSGNVTVPAADSCGSSVSSADSCGSSVSDTDSCGSSVSDTGSDSRKNGRVTAMVEGFVPPLLDIMAEGSHFQKGQAEINDINRQIDRLSGSEAYCDCKKSLEESEHAAEVEIASYSDFMNRSKVERKSLRSQTSDPSILSRLQQESQFQKAELRRIRKRWDSILDAQKEKLSGMENQLRQLKEKRRRMSDQLQRWIFDNYKVCNGLGETASVWDIFQEQGLVPPGGTGDCAAPKLLDYAFRHGLKPLAMGEFWYGRSPANLPRLQGCFYPSCTSKCGPLLPWMLKGVDVDWPATTDSDGIRILYEDEYMMAVVKPSGMLSVPGKDGSVSLEERLPGVFAVHRLDMDTSGILLFAKSREIQSALRKQFEQRTVRKIYQARLSRRLDRPVGYRDTISLPLSPDYENRPLQKVDFDEGKEALTEYEILRHSPEHSSGDECSDFRSSVGITSVTDQGWTDVYFFPKTGRTHQLRVHSAHPLGLGNPIKGDPLYGGCDAGSSRLYLHAAAIDLVHPVTGKPIHLEDPIDWDRI